MEPSVNISQKIQTVKRTSMKPCKKCLNGKMFLEADGELVCVSCGYTEYPQPILAKVHGNEVR